MVTPGEKKKWDLLSYMYMTELSDDPDDKNSFIERTLPWRSQSKGILSLFTCCIKGFQG